MNKKAENIIVGIELYERIPKKPIITMKRFANFLYKIRLEYLTIDPGGEEESI